MDLVIFLVVVSLIGLVVLGIGLLVLGKIVSNAAPEFLSPFNITMEMVLLSGILVGVSILVVAGVMYVIGSPKE